jgi:CDP-glucose 4,6-dehydratase
MLASRGAEVCGYALAPATDPNLYEAAGIGRLATSVIADIRDAPRLKAEMQAFKPEIVFHLAAQALVRPAYDDPVHTFSVNVMGTVHLLEAVRATPSVRAVVIVTSDKVYENREWCWAYREPDALGGREPYGVSKACAELATTAYRHSYFADRDIEIATARAGNVIGGGDWSKDRIVPDAMRAFASSKPLRLRNPDAVRPWQHVLESIAGYCALAQAMLWQEPLGEAPSFNFGPMPQDALPVQELVERLAARWGAAKPWMQEPGHQPYEARLLEVDSAKARSMLGWRPVWNVEETLDRTVDWYKAHHGGVDMHRMTLAQVQDHADASDR